MTQRKRCTYDHRVKTQVIAARNPNLFPELEIPRSTASSWIRRGLGNVVSFDEVGQTESHFRERIAKLEGSVSMLTAVLRLGLVLLHLSGFRLGLGRVADAEGKRRILGAIERARQLMPLTSALRVLGLSAGRYHDWVGRQEVCSLDDQRNCPRSKPQCLMYQEVEAIGDMVQSKAYRQIPNRGLALHAQRIGKVFAHPGTWAKLIRERGG